MDPIEPLVSTEPLLPTEIDGTTWSDNMSQTRSNGTTGFNHIIKFSETTALGLTIMLGVSWDHGSH